MVKVIWTDSAIEDLNEIGERISRNSERYAQITVGQLFEAPSILEKHPKAGPMVPDFQNNSIRQLIRGNFRIVYKIVDAFRIDILTVHWCARSIENTYDFE